MTLLTDFCTEIRDWIDDTDPSDALITSWARDAEERFNNELRTVEQTVRTYATFDDNCSVLPADWLEFLYVRLKGGKPFDFITNHDYWLYQDGPALVQPDPYGAAPYPSSKQVYTTIGKTLFVKPDIDPAALTQIEICYYRMISPLDTTADPVFYRYRSLYRYATLAAGAPYLVEDERLQTWASLATAGIAKANDATKQARHSGSPIAPRIRGFG